MKNSQRAGSQDDRAGTARMRRWSEEKLSVRLLLVAFVLVLTGAGVWAGWFASLSPSQAATWSVVLISIAVVGASASANRRPRMSRSR
jgi:cytochrome b subunit of formate dehydrogenase